MMEGDVDQFPETPPGKRQEALLGMVSWCSQDQTGVDQHRLAGHGREVTVEDEMFTDVRTVLEIASEAIGVAAIKAQAVEGRGARDFAITGEGSLTWIDPGAEEAVIGKYAGPACRKFIEKRRE